MSEYRVTWTIDVDLLPLALFVQQSAGSLATVFEVTEIFSRFPSDGRPWQMGETVEIDLSEPEGNE